MSESVEHRPVVTLAALYGAGGTVIGPRVAERLGVPFLDREIPAAAARELGLSGAAVEDVDDAPRSTLRRITGALGRTSTLTGGTGGSAERLEVEERNVRASIEELLARADVQPPPHRHRSRPADTVRSHDPHRGVARQRPAGLQPGPARPPPR